MTLFSIGLAIDPEALPDMEVTLSVLALFLFIALMLIGFDRFDRWLERRGSPVDRLLRHRRQAGEGR